MFTKEKKEDWVTALRSGDYRQTEGTLYHAATDSFCALGVYISVVTGFNREQMIQVAAHGDFDPFLRDIPPSIQALVINWNDTGEDFDTIADRIDTMTYDKRSIEEL